MDTGSTVINYGRLCQLYSKKDTGIILIWSPGPKESVSADATIVVQAAASCLLWGPAALVSQMSNGSDSRPSARVEAGPLCLRLADSSAVRRTNTQHVGFVGM